MRATLSRGIAYQRGAVVWHGHCSETGNYPEGFGMNVESLLGTLGTIGGLVVAIGIFLFSARLVAKARKGNRLVREARNDPHVDTDAGRHSGDRRDIGQ
jgi:hypothetical protein